MRFFLLVPFAAAAVFTAFACSSSDDATTPPPAGPPPTYEKDVYPILQANCALTGCHGANLVASDPDAGPPLGVHISPYDKDDAYKSLINVPSRRFTGTKLILPGDPDNSLVMRKMDGTQAQLESCPGECGTSMPPPDDNGAPQLLSKKKRDTVRAWIKAGAENN